MIAMTIGRVAELVGGRTDSTVPDLLVHGDAFIDSRRVVRDGLFAALLGTHRDGHDFASSAIEGGAAAVLAGRPVGVAAVVVDSVPAALGGLARAVVQGIPGLTVVAITGSQGKTSTKDLLAAVLEPVAPTVSPVDSLNNEIGVPLTALRARTDTRFLISEMGARAVGDIADLCAIVGPQVGVVLNVGVAHLGEFGDIATTARAKGELVESLPADGVAVLNADDPLVWAMRERTDARVVSFGTTPAADVVVSDTRVDAAGRPSFRLTWRARSAPVSLNLVGAHQIGNAAAAATAGLACHVAFDRVVDALSNARPRSRWRMEVTTTRSGLTVVNDAYNANPDSTLAALRTLAGLGLGRPPGGRTVAVLGEMLELGPASEAAHADIGREAARLGISRLVVVGEGARPIHRAASDDDSWDGTSTWVHDAEAAIDQLTGALRPADVVLVKASRATGLERVALDLTDQGTPR